MLRHWFSVAILLVPVMAFGWLISSVFIWKLIPTLRWVEALVLAACITATDPVLASAVVGKGKFAQRVPGHLRNLLSAESGCNDGMAFPFAYLALLCILDEGNSRDVAFHWIVITVLYECVFGCVLGAIIGYVGRHLIKFAEQKKLIDRESFLVFYFVLALFCTGVGSIIGVDDLLVAFSAGAAFSWDGWFSKKTEESHVSDVIDLLLNMSFFVYFGAIVPWDQFNNEDLGISVWKLVIIAILVILFRRLPIMLALKPVIPDIKTWREALFCGHFGPIGVGAIFMAILSRAELEHGEPTPLADLPGPGTPNYYVIATIWPVVTFLIVASIVVHGSSIAVFTLGKRLNNLTITMTNTTKGSTQGWLSRLGTESRTFSLHRVDTQNPDFPEIAPSTNPEKPGLDRRKKRRKVHKKKRRNGEEPTPPEAIALDLSGNNRAETTEVDMYAGSSSSKDGSPEHTLDEEHIAIVAAGKDGEDTEIKLKPSDMTPELREKLGITAPGEATPPRTSQEEQPRGEGVNGGSDITAYKLGDKLVIEDANGEVLQTIRSRTSEDSEHHREKNKTLSSHPRVSRPTRTSPPPPQHRRGSVSRRGSDLGPARGVISGPHHKSRKITAYQLDDNIIVENEEGEIIKRYHINYKDGEHDPQSSQNPGYIDRTLSHFGIRRRSTIGAADLEKQPPNLDSFVPGVPVAISSGSAQVPRQRVPLQDERIRKRLKKLLISDPEVNPNAFGVESDSASSGDGYSSEDDEEELSPTATAPQINILPGAHVSVPPSALNAMGRVPASSPVSRPPRLDDDEEETAIERQRRLAALGIIQDEEEDDEPEQN